MILVRCSKNQNRWPTVGKKAFGATVHGHPSGLGSPVAIGDLSQRSMKGKTMKTTMFPTSENLADLNKVNVAQASKLTAIALDNAEKLVKLNVNASRAILARSVESASAIAAVKDMQDLFALRSTFAESGVETATTYVRSLYEISAEAQAQFTALTEEAWSTYTKDLAGWVEKAGRSAPAGSEAAVNAFKSTFAASTAAFDQLQKATKQVVSIADASVRAASANALNATKAAGHVRKAA
jgi:phasin family protein